MAWTLCELSAVLLRRRVRAPFVRAPLPAALVALALLASPVALARAGDELASIVGPTAWTAELVRQLAIGLFVTAAGAGAVLSSSLGALAGLGVQVEVAPVGRSRALACLGLVPLGLLVVGASVSLLAFLVPLTAALPGGLGLAAALTGGAIACAHVGAVGVEAARLALAGRPGGIACLTALALVWLAPGWSDTALGPLGAAAAYGPGGAPGPMAAVSIVAVLVAALVTWPLLAARRPPRRSVRSRPRARVWIPSSRTPAAFVGAATILLRRPETRVGVVGGAGIACLGVAAGITAGLPTPILVVLSSSSAALAAATASLVAGAVVEETRALWQPVGAGAVSCALAVPAVATPVATASVVAVAAGSVLGTAPAGVGAAAAASVLVAGAALAAGALIPWTRGGLADHLVGFAVFGACGVVAAYGAGLVARGLERAGAPADLAASAPLLAVVLLAVSVLRLRAGRI